MDHILSLSCEAMPDSLPRGAVFTEWLTRGNGGALREPVHGFITAHSRSHPQRHLECYATAVATDDYHFTAVDSSLTATRLLLRLGDNRVLSAHADHAERTQDPLLPPAAASAMSPPQSLLFALAGNGQSYLGGGKSGRALGWVQLLSRPGAGQYFPGLKAGPSPAPLRPCEAQRLLCPRGMRVVGFQVRSGWVLDNVRLLLLPAPVWTPEHDGFFAPGLRLAVATMLEAGRGVLPVELLLKIASYLQEEDF